MTIPTKRKTKKKYKKSVAKKIRVNALSSGDLITSPGGMRSRIWGCKVWPRVDGTEDV